MSEGLDIPLIWAGLLALAVFLYVLLDGFDLGLGILFPFAPDDRDRDTMMNSVAPVWDGNETWLVLGGGGLFAAFPKAYAALMPAVYMPIGFMLTALIFRGVAFEFRFKAEGAMRQVWSQAFHWGSIVAAFAQGLILGAMVQGIALVDGRFAGGMFDWLTPFSFFTGCALVWGYALLGATWLMIKAEGGLHEWARQMAFIAVAVVVLCMAIVSVWVPALDLNAAARWGIKWPLIDWSRLLPLLPVPLLVALATWLLVRNVRTHAHSARAFLCAVALFALGYLGLGLSLYPYLVPYALTIHEAAAARNSQLMLLYGALVLLPVILCYTGYVYWIFRGKVIAGGGYH